MMHLLDSSIVGEVSCAGYASHAFYAPNISSTVVRVHVDIHAPFALDVPSRVWPGWDTPSTSVRPSGRPRGVRSPDRRVFPWSH